MTALSWWCHRIIKWLVLEETPSVIKFQIPCHKQGYQPPDPVLDQVAQGPIQPGLEHFQWWSIHSLSGQPVPAPHHSVKNFPLTSNLNLPSLSLKPSHLVLSLTAHEKNDSPTVYNPLLNTGRLQWCLLTAFSSPDWTSPAPLVCLHMAGAPALVWYSQPSSGLSPTAPHLSVLGAPDLDTVLHLEPHKCRVERDNHLTDGHASSDGGVGLSDCKRTLQTMSNFSFARTFKSFSAGLVYEYSARLWVLCLVLHMALLNLIRSMWEHFFTLVHVHLGSIPSFCHINCTTQCSFQSFQQTCCWGHW